jgi:hypothetical protein
VTDEVGNEIALGAVLNAEIAIFEDLAQAGCPLGLTGEVVHEFPRLVGHRFLHQLTINIWSRRRQAKGICPVVIAASSAAG